MICPTLEPNPGCATVSTKCSYFPHRFTRQSIYFSDKRYSAARQSIAYERPVNRWVWDSNLRRNPIIRSARPPARIPELLHTGGGALQAEGLVGLARAFLYAGAHEVVVSMQPVSDIQTTCDFVKIFYEEYLVTGEADIPINKAQKHMDLKVDFSGKHDDFRKWGFYYVIRQEICD